MTRTTALRIHPLHRIGRALIARFDPTLFRIGATSVAIVTGTAVLGADDVDATAGTGKDLLVDAQVSGLANVERVGAVSVDAGKGCHDCCIDLKQGYILCSFDIEIDLPSYRSFIAVSSLSAKTVKTIEFDNDWLTSTTDFIYRSKKGLSSTMGGGTVERAFWWRSYTLWWWGRKQTLRLWLLQDVTYEHATTLRRR